MKKNILILLIILLAKTTSFSQTILNDSIVSITPEQLKKTNLIFIEHESLSKINSLLYKQISNYKENTSLLLQTDSIRKLEIDNYKELTKSLNNDIKKKDKVIQNLKIGSTITITVLVLWLLFR